MSQHGNCGNNIKNLRGTSGCKHYSGLQASALSSTKCAVNGCSKDANRACHVIFSNQNAGSATRYIVYMCPSCNATYTLHNIRYNAIMYQLADCICGTL